MLEQYKSVIWLLILGAIFTVLGALLKIMHLPLANVLLILGLLFQGIGLLTLVVKLLKKSNK